MKLKFFLIKTLLCSTAFTTSYGMENDLNFNRQGMKRVAPDTGFDSDSDENQMQKKAKTDDTAIAAGVLSEQELQKFLNFYYSYDDDDLLDLDDGSIPSPHDLRATWDEIEKKAMNDYRWAKVFMQFGPAERQSELSKHIINQATIGNNSEAQLVLGIMYRYGTGGLSMDHAKAIEFLEKSAESGNACAAYELAILYDLLTFLDDFETSFERPYARNHNNEIVKWLNFSGQKGFLPAVVLLCHHYTYEYENIFKLDIEKAIELYNIGARIGNPRCQFELAMLYKYGHAADKLPAEGFIPNYSEALRWFLENLESLECVIDKTVIPVREISKLVRYKSPNIMPSSLQSFDFSPIKAMHASIADLAYPFSLYGLFSDPVYEFQEKVQNSGHLHNIFSSMGESVNTWKSVLERIQSYPQKLFLTRLIPINKKIKKDLLETNSDGISAYDYEGDFYLSVGEAATTLSRDIMNMVGKNGTINHMIRLLKEHNQSAENKISLEKFIEEVQSMPRTVSFKSINVDELVTLFTQLEKLLVSFIKDHAYERDQAFIKQYPTLEHNQ